MRPERLLGVDVARGIALIGMMSVHILPSLDRDGTASSAYQVAAGRASALFAVLAGLSLVLATRARGDDGSARGARRGVIARAVFVAGIGLVLGTLGTGVAVILVHYAALFAVAALFMGAGTRTLMITSAGWLLLSPVAGHLIRPRLAPGPRQSPSLLSLSHPNELVTGVLFTGYYPVLQWTGYLLVGMAVGRLALHRARTAARLLTVGVLLAVGAKVLSAALLLGPAAGGQWLTVPPSSVFADRDLATVLQTGMYGTTPTTSWWWLAVSAPHSGTPPDLVHTTGTALAVIGACLLAARALPSRWRWAVLPVAAAGSMTLTLYTLHVIALAAARAWSPSPAALLTVNVLLALLVATAWQRTSQRGPLEAVAARISAAARAV